VIYLDWNATTPPHPDVLEAMREAALSAWANPASVHGPGRRARAHVERAREAVAALTGFDARDVVMTSGGTEANNLALAWAAGDAAAKAEAPPGLVVSRIEHPSIIRMVEALERAARIFWVEPSFEGVVTVESVTAALDRAAREGGARLVVLQAVNHETGVIQPVAEVAAAAHARGALLHVDAVQAVGRLPPSTWSGADLVSVAAHKIRGPKGIGALVTRPGIRLRPVLLGGAQEKGLRPGTQDAASCAGFAVAAEHAMSGPARYELVRALRDRLEAELVRIGEELGAAPIRNGGEPRAPHISNLSWPGWRGDELCAALDLEGVAVSSGSACSAGTAEPSPVLRAMMAAGAGESAGEARALSAVRVSLGEETSLADVVEAVTRWRRVLVRVAG
jgi:cysteine desulfurase